MDTSSLLSSATLMSTIAVKAFGFPHQIRENFIRKSTQGLSRPLYWLSFISYCLWTAHGIRKGDYVVIVGQGLGVVTTALILGQIIVYGKRSDRRAADRA